MKHTQILSQVAIHSYLPQVAKSFQALKQEKKKKEKEDRKEKNKLYIYFLLSALIEHCK